MKTILLILNGKYNAVDSTKIKTKGEKIHKLPVAIPFPIKCLQAIWCSCCYGNMSIYTAIVCLSIFAKNETCKKLAYSDKV